jgi:hypothetical protein
MPTDLHDAAARRRLYITLARKRARPGSGSGPDVLWARTWRRPVFDLRSLVSVPFLVVGGVATRLYAPERMTDDLDVLVPAASAERLSEELTRGGAVRRGRLAVGGSHWRLPDGTPLDVLEEDAPWVAEALARPASGPDGLPVIGLPYLILMKMRASRGIDIGDLTRILGAADEAALEETRRVIGRYLSDGTEDLESLIQLGRLEYQSAREGRTQDEG